MLSRRSKASPTRGWRKTAPRKPSARKALKSKCGSKCFLLPSENKFPICDAACGVSCKGLVAAKVRSAQWKYPSVYRKASAMINKRKCTKRSRGRT